MHEDDESPVWYSIVFGLVYTCIYVYIVLCGSFIRFHSEICMLVYSTNEFKVTGLMVINHSLYEAIGMALN